MSKYKLFDDCMRVYGMSGNKVIKYETDYNIIVWKDDCKKLSNIHTEQTADGISLIGDRDTLIELWIDNEEK